MFNRYGVCLSKLMFSPSGLHKMGLSQGDLLKPRRFWTAERLDLVHL